MKTQRNFTDARFDTKHVLIASNGDGVCAFSSLAKASVPGTHSAAADGSA